MFELTKDLLDKIGRAIMPDAELVPVGPHFEAVMRCLQPWNMQEWLSGCL